LGRVRRGSKSGADASSRPGSDQAAGLGYASERHISNPAVVGSALQRGKASAVTRIAVRHKTSVLHCWAILSYACRRHPLWSRFYRCLCAMMLCTITFHKRTTAL
jgi:hypothetical protein